MKQIDLVWKRIDLRFDLFRNIYTGYKKNARGLFIGHASITLPCLNPNCFNAKNLHASGWFFILFSRYTGSIMKASLSVHSKASAKRKHKGSKLNLVGSTVLILSQIYVNNLENWTFISHRNSKVTARGGTFRRLV